MATSARTSRSKVAPRGTPTSTASTEDDGDEFEWIIYVRISDDREGRGLGVARQEKDCRRHHGAANLGGRILCVLVDNDLTAFSQSRRYKPRPDYDRLDGLLRERPGRRGILSWHTDRLHRSPRELEDFIDVVEQTGAPVHTVKAGQIDLSTPSGRMAARVYCAVARHESEHKAQRVNEKVAELAEAGKIANGGPRPFGYNRIFSGEGPRRKILRDEVNEAEAAIIRECARRYLGGDTLRSIVRWLNGEGHQTSTGRLWTQQALRFMLMSGRIAGLRERRGQIVGPAVWDAIIEEDQHEQLRAMLASTQRPPGSRVRKHFLSGFVYCTKCVLNDVKMRVCVQAGVLKYKCPSDDGCNGRVIRLADLEQEIGDAIVAKLSDPRTLKQLAAREGDVSNATADLLKRIEDDERRLALLKGALDDGDEDELVEVVESVVRLRRRLADARRELAEISGAPGLTRESLPDLADRWDDLDLDQRRTLVGMFIDRILIAPAVRGRSTFDPDRVTIVPKGAWPRVAAELSKSAHGEAENGYAR